MDLRDLRLISLAVCKEEASQTPVGLGTTRHAPAHLAFLLLLLGAGQCDDVAQRRSQRLVLRPGIQRDLWAEEGVGDAVVVRNEMHRREIRHWLEGGPLDLSF
jgi:hypothetical protein